VTDGQSVSSLWLEEAQEAAEQRRFAEAVAMYVRFHEHVLDHDPGMRGVRSSFAVGDWGRLAVAYPPARDAMIATRDRAVARLKDPSVLRDDGNPGVALDDLQGVLALNEELRRPEDIVALVRWLDEHRPDLAVEGASVVRAVLVAEGELEVAARYLGDANAAVEAWAAVLNEQTADEPEDPTGRRADPVEPCPDLRKPGRTGAERAARDRPARGSRPGGRRGDHRGGPPGCRRRRPDPPPLTARQPYPPRPTRDGETRSRLDKADRSLTQHALLPHSLRLDDARNRYLS
jgi:hypothetical protein